MARSDLFPLALLRLSNRPKTIQYFIATYGSGATTADVDLSTAVDTTRTVLQWLGENPSDAQAFAGNLSTLSWVDSNTVRATRFSGTDSGGGTIASSVVYGVAVEYY